MPRAKLWDPEFRYVPAAETDIRKTLARAKRELAAAAKAQAAEAAEATAKVKPIRRKEAAQ